jgi:hypothetical protein
MGRQMVEQQARENGSSEDLHGGTGETGFGCAMNDRPSWNCADLKKGTNLRPAYQMFPLPPRMTCGVHRDAVR